MHLSLLFLLLLSQAPTSSLSNPSESKPDNDNDTPEQISTLKKQITNLAETVDDTNSIPTIPSNANTKTESSNNAILAALTKLNMRLDKLEQDLQSREAASRDNAAIDANGDSRRGITSEHVYSQAHHSQPSHQMEEEDEKEEEEEERQIPVKQRPIYLPPLPNTPQIEYNLIYPLGNTTVHYPFVTLYTNPTKFHLLSTVFKPLAHTCFPDDEDKNEDQDDEEEVDDGDDDDDSGDSSDDESERSSVTCITLYPQPTNAFNLPNSLFLPKFSEDSPLFPAIVGEVIRLINEDNEEEKEEEEEAEHARFTLINPRSLPLTMNLPALSIDVNDILPSRKNPIKDQASSNSTAKVNVLTIHEDWKVEFDRYTFTPLPLQLGRKKRDHKVVIIDTLLYYDPTALNVCENLRYSYSHSHSHSQGSTAYDGDGDNDNDNDSSDKGNAYAFKNVQILHKPPVELVDYVVFRDWYESYFNSNSININSDDDDDDEENENDENENDEHDETEETNEKENDEHDETEETNELCNAFSHLPLPMQISAGLNCASPSNLGSRFSLSSSEYDRIKYIRIMLSHSKKWLLSKHSSSSSSSLTAKAKAKAKINPNLVKITFDPPSSLANKAAIIKEYLNLSLEICNTLLPPKKSTLTRHACTSITPKLQTHIANKVDELMNDDNGIGVMQRSYEQYRLDVLGDESGMEVKEDIDREFASFIAKNVRGEKVRS